MLDNLVNIQERNNRKRKQPNRRKTLDQWLLEYEEYENFRVFEPHKNKRTKSTSNDHEYKDYRSQKHNFRRHLLRERKWAVDE